MTATELEGIVSIHEWCGKIIAAEVGVDSTQGRAIQQYDYQLRQAYDQQKHTKSYEQPEFKATLDLRVAHLEQEVAALKEMVRNLGTMKREPLLWPKDISGAVTAPGIQTLKCGGTTGARGANRE